MPASFLPVRGVNLQRFPDIDILECSVVVRKTLRFDLGFLISYNQSHRLIFLPACFRSCPNSDFTIRDLIAGIRLINIRCFPGWDCASAYSGGFRAGFQEYTGNSSTIDRPDRIIDRPFCNNFSRRTLFESNRLW